MMRRWICIAALSAAVACERAGDAKKVIHVHAPFLLVSLIDPGSEPRAPLRFQLTTGRAMSERTVATVVHDHGRTLERPLSYSRHETVLIGADGAGRARYRSVDVDESQLQVPGSIPTIAWLDPQRALIGSVAEWWTDARGVTEDAEITVDADADVEDQFGYSPESAAVLPKEPIGTGARWSVYTVTRGASGTTWFELTERQGDHFTLTSHFVVHHRTPELYDVDGTADRRVSSDGSLTSRSRGKVTAGEVTADITVDSDTVRK